MNEDFIYTVTAGNLEHNNWRCWAWFATLEEAQQAIEGCSDFFAHTPEGQLYYFDLVIEEVPRGAITPQYREWWYKWEGDEWRPQSKPESVDTLYHFGVG